MYLMRTHSLYGGQLNWARIADSVHYKARTARTLDEAMPALAYAFDQLKDYHGMVATENANHRFPPPFDPAARLSASIRQEYLKGPRLRTARLGPDVAYLRMPAMIGTKPEVVNRWAGALRDSLCRLLQARPAALVVDLRMNNGGNSAPMLTGLSALLGNGAHIYAADRTGRLTPGGQLRQGVAVDAQGQPLTEAPKVSCAPNLAIPVAVLIGPGTSSSGEIMAMMLRDRPRTRLFGTPTGRYCSATEGYLLANNTAYLLLTTNRMAGADKRINTAEEVVPDETVSNAQDNFAQPQADPTVQAALRWLRAQRKVPGRKGRS